MGIFDMLFGKPQEKKLEPFRQEQIEANMEVAFVPERGLTDAEQTMAQAVIQEFKELFGDQVFCSKERESTYDYKVFKREAGEMVYGHDLGEMEGPFMVTKDQLQDEVFKDCARQTYERHNTGEADYQHRLFVFRRGKDEALFYADSKGVSEFCAAGMSI